MSTKKNNYNELMLDLDKVKIIKIFHAISTFKTVNRKSLIDELSATINIGFKEIEFVLGFLLLNKKITDENQTLKIKENLNPDLLIIEFSKYYFNLIINNEELNQKLFIQSDVKLENDFFKIKTSSIKMKFRKILISLSKLGLLQHEDDYVKIINYTVAKKFIERTLNRLAKSQKEFEKEQYEKKIRGDLAEEFVKLHEERKLKDLPFNPVRQSLDDVGLGYDILSFDNKGNEMFIEVKSIVSNRFFWTNNEIKTSKELQNDYYIYLVKFKDNKPSKIEKIIQNPYDKIFIKEIYQKENIEDYIVFL